MPNTFQLISSVTVGAGGAASIDFTSIPATYTDLVVRYSCRSTSTGTALNMYMKLNTSTANFSMRVLGGNGSSAVSYNYSGDDGRALLWTANYDDSTSNTFGNADIYITNYAGSTNKAISTDGVMENNATDARMSMTATLWSNTAAITGVSLFPQAGTLKQYSTAYLYGVKNA